MIYWAFHGTARMMDMVIHQIPVVASEDLAVDVSTFSEVTQRISRAPAQTSGWLHVVLCDGQIPTALLSLLQILQKQRH